MKLADPVLQAVLEAAVAGTGGTDGWLFALRGDRLEVVAVTGPGTGDVLGTTVRADSGTAGFVVGADQPIATGLRPEDARATSGMTAIGRRPPSSVLSIPCDTEEGVAGALEVVDKVDGGRFTFDDVELATLLAGIAGVVLRERPSLRGVPAPDELIAELRRLADRDLSLYATVSTLVHAFVARA